MSAAPSAFRPSARGLLAALLLVPATLAPAAAAPQLIPSMFVAGPAGWSSGIIPRMTTDGTLGTLAPSESLLSTAPTYLDWSTFKNAAVCGTWTDVLDLDGERIQALVKSDCEWAYKAMPAINQGPTMVRGGRHELHVQADLYREVCTDYSFLPGGLSLQYVWSPMTLSSAFLRTSDRPPPPHGYFALPNCDGYEIARANGWAWVVSSLGYSPPNNADLVLYDDPWQGGNTGFSHERARSAQAPGVVDFVVGGETATPVSFFPAVIQGSSPSPTGPYAIGWADAANRRGAWGSEWVDQSMGAKFAVVHEVYLEAGVPVPMDLTRTVGAEDLAFAIFPPTPGGVWSRDQALAVSTPYQGDLYDALTFTATETGWHPLVVYRVTNATIGGEEDYTLRVGPTAIVGVPVSGATLFFANAGPSPARDRTNFSFGLPVEGEARLTIEDVQGRAVRTLIHGRESAGRHAVGWDLRDGSGAAVGPGVYWARFEAGGRRFTSRLVVLR